MSEPAGSAGTRRDHNLPASEHRTDVHKHKSRNVPKVTDYPEPPDILVDQRHKRRYRRLPLLGTGGFARVYEVRDEHDNRYAAKVVAKASLRGSKHLQKLKHEIKIHSKMNHPNIVGYYAYFDDDQNVYIILELCANKSLQDMVRARKRLNDLEIRFYMLDLLQAVEYMHSRSVIHRDLKLGNLFLSHDMHLKVGDFGLATELRSEDERKKTICGTPNYIAPEVLFDQDRGHSFEVDIWSLGVILFTMIVGKPPFQTSDVRSIYKRIQDIEYQFPKGLDVNPDAKELVEALLQKSPTSRPSAHQIRHFAFFNGPVPNRISPSALTEPTAVTRAGYAANRAAALSSSVQTTSIPASTSASTQSKQLQHEDMQPTRGGMAGSMASANLAHLNPHVELTCKSEQTMATQPTTSQVDAGSKSSNHGLAQTFASNAPTASDDSAESNGGSHTPRQIRTVIHINSQPLLKLSSDQNEEAPRIAKQAPNSISGRLERATPNHTVNRLATDTVRQTDRHFDPLLIGSTNLVKSDADHLQDVTWRWQSSSEYHQPRQESSRAAEAAEQFSRQVTRSNTAQSQLSSQGNSAGPSDSSANTVKATPHTPSISSPGSQRFMTLTLDQRKASEAKHQNFQPSSSATDRHSSAPKIMHPSSSLHSQPSAPASDLNSAPLHSAFGQSTSSVRRNGSDNASTERLPSTSTYMSSAHMASKSQDAHSYKLPTYSHSSAPASSQYHQHSSSQQVSSGASSKDLNSLAQKSPTLAVGKLSHRFGQEIYTAPPETPAASRVNGDEYKIHSSHASKPSLGSVTEGATGVYSDVLSTPSAMPVMSDPEQGMSSLERMARSLSFAWQHAHDIGPLSEIKLQSLRLTDYEPPHVFLVKCIDYSNKYGLGYQLTNGVTGVSFNDSTVLVIAPNGHHFEYLFHNRSNSVLGQNVMKRQAHTISNYPSILSKKVTLLGHFREYMDQNMLQLPYTFSDTSKTSELEFVTRFFRHKTGVIYRLSNHVLQINFHDHTKILFSYDARLITFIDKARVVRHFQLADLQHIKAQAQAAAVAACMPASSTSAAGLIRDHAIAEQLIGRLAMAKDIVEWVLAKRRRAAALRAGIEPSGNL